MAIPLVYNVRSMAVRKTQTLIAMLTIAGVVAIFVAIYSMAQGFQKTFTASGSAYNAIVLRAGATTESYSWLSIEDVKIVQNAPGIKQVDGAPLFSAESLWNANFALQASGTEVWVQVRGVSEKALAVRDSVNIVEGRFIKPGVAELVVGKNAAQQYDGLNVGNTIQLGNHKWKVVGIFDGGGSAFDSEIWMDTNLLNSVSGYGKNNFQSVIVRLNSPKALDVFRDALSIDPRLTVSVKREIDYYGGQSETISKMMKSLGLLVISIMALGAIIGALKTMYSSIVSRVREIATLRAIGFSQQSIVMSFLLESMLIAAMGGLIGLLLVIPMHGYSMSTLNTQTWSYVTFTLYVTPGILMFAMLFALVMGFLGGLFPALYAARQPITKALRGL